MMAGGFKELTLHDFWNSNKALTPQQSDMFYMACYDLDRFRRFVFETRFLQLFEVDEARVEALRTGRPGTAGFRHAVAALLHLRRELHEAASGSRAGQGEAADESQCRPNPVLIIGGGIAGLTAAVELADTGVRGGPGGEIGQPGRTRGAHASVFPQALPARLRPGNALSAACARIPRSRC